MATFQDAWQRTARTMGYPAGTSDFNNGQGYTASIKTWIDESNKKNRALIPAVDISATISTVSGTSEYDLPSDFSKMIEMWYIQGTRKIQIFPLERDEFLNLESVVSSAIQFLYYTVRKDANNGKTFNKVAIYPAAQTTGFTIYYRYQQMAASLNTDPSSTTDSSTVLTAPAGFENLDVMYALEQGYLQREDSKMASEWGQRYRELFRQYKEYASNPRRSLVIKKGVLTSINPNLYPILTGYS